MWQKVAKAVLVFVKKCPIYTSFKIDLSAAHKNWIGSNIKRGRFFKFEAQDIIFDSDWTYFQGFASIYKWSSEFQSQKLSESFIFSFFIKSNKLVEHSLLLTFLKTSIFENSLPIYFSLSLIIFTIITIISLECVHFWPNI